MSRGRRPGVAVLGAGRLARALVPLLVRAGYRVAAVASRSGRSAKALARRAKGARAGSDLAAAAASAEIVLLAVPDREIAPLARNLARDVADWSGRTALHHAGALGTAPLAPLARRGARVGVLHPLLAPGAGPAAFPGGARARIEGDAPARRTAERMARDLGLVPFRLPSRPGGPDRAAYHAAASLASNDVVALLAAAVDLLRDAGLSERSALAALIPLARGAVDRIGEEGPARALTGPVARGDARTLRAQLRRLARLDRDALRAHLALSARLLRLAASAGRLDRAGREEIRRAIEEARRGPARGGAV